MKWYWVKQMRVDEETLDSIKWWVNRQGFCDVKDGTHIVTITREDLDYMREVQD